MSNQSQYEYIMDKRMNDHEELCDLDDEEYEEWKKSPCRNCNGKKYGKCQECEV
jgi:hypothetical protein